MTRNTPPEDKEVLAWPVAPKSHFWLANREGQLNAAICRLAIDPQLQRRMRPHVGARLHGADRRKFLSATRRTFQQWKADPAVGKPRFSNSLPLLVAAVCLYFKSIAP